jgi:hypothetical protein
MMHAYAYAMQMQYNYGAKHLRCYTPARTRLLRSPRTEERREDYYTCVVRNEEAYK